MTSFNTLKNLVEKINADQKVKGELKGWNVAFQFNPSDGNKYYLSIDDSGFASLSEGEHSSPVTSLSATDEVFDGVFSGRMNPIQAFMSGKLKLSGDIGKAQELVSVLDELM
ncbi:MAG: SCP2 sterol-binding domain-containing protein [Thermoplasmata archaeon]|uniref:SCP2 sterol-binding domain-containing protein n=1 Tax=Candidatus Sysuiplasma superficiale TaxID=2823368 RepID=A0A8J8CE63_9ARCH|nr:SCP2 sterol-binding domain-containing protein [Candidatus Sysuiplasma superficiale]MBX8644307.1 SCP2 sterol-binding domain-containing protein [Candidatus Sysuiplasma superficiale]